MSRSWCRISERMRRLVRLFTDAGHAAAQYGVRGAISSCVAIGHHFDFQAS